MNTYWITFRIEQVGNHSQRYQRLLAVVALCGTGKHWDEPTSFILFKSTKSIDEIKAAVASAIDVSQDVALIGMPEFKDGRVVGKLKDNDLFLFMPFAQRP